MGLRIGASPFMGRGQELDALAAAFAQAVAGQPRAVLVTGDAGVGKSRLVEQFCREAAAGGAVVAIGGCVPTDSGGVAFGPFVAMASALGGASGFGGWAAERNSRTTPFGSRMLDDLAKARLFESMLTALTTTSERAPAIVVVEDIHWIDSASAELLTFLTRNLQDARVLILATYRGDEVGVGHPRREWLVELGRHPRVSTVRLGGLGADDSARLVVAIVGATPRRVIEAVWARSQGNPFFIEELAAAGDATALPDELKRLVLTRVERLSVEARGVVRAAAAAGPTAPHSLLEALGVASDDALEEAVGNHVLVVDPTGTGYRFRHALLREAVLSSILPGERRRLHRQLASALTPPPGRGVGQLSAELAWHWWEAGDWPEALGASLAAADEAAATWAFPEALGHLDRAIQALDRIGGSARSQRVDLLARASDIAYLAGEGRRSVELAHEAIAFVDDSVDPIAAARLWMLLGRNAWSVDDSTLAFEAARRAAALLPDKGPSVERARLEAEEARWCMLMSHYRDAELRCHDALRTARAAGARSEEGHALNTLGCSVASLGRYEEGIELLRQSLAIAEEIELPDDLDRAYGNLTALLGDAGRLDEAVSIVYDSLAVGEAVCGVRLNSAAASGSECLVRLGRFDEAEALAAAMGERGLSSCSTGPLFAPLPPAVRRGRFDEAARLLAVIDDMIAARSDVQTRGSFHMLSAELALEDGRPDEAFVHIEQALSLAAGTDDVEYRPEMCALGARALADQAILARSEGRQFDLDKARLLAANLIDEASRLAMGPRAQAFAATGAAEQSRLYETDPEAWAEAAARWEAAQEPFPAAYCRWRQAEALIAGRTQRSRATACLQAGWRSSRAMGTRPLTERIERLAQRARIALGDGDAPEPGGALASDLGLTPREVEVLALLAARRTDHEIAEALFISKKTASVHVSNLLRKLVVTSRVEAGKIGHAHGLG